MIYNPWAVLKILSMIEVLAASIGNIVNDDVATPKYECQQNVNRVSTEHQQSINTPSTVHEQCINNFGQCVL